MRSETNRHQSTLHLDGTRRAASTPASVADECCAVLLRTIEASGACGRLREYSWETGDEPLEHTRHRCQAGRRIQSGLREVWAVPNLSETNGLLLIIKMGHYVAYCTLHIARESEIMCIFLLTSCSVCYPFASPRFHRACRPPPGFETWSSPASQRYSTFG